MSPPVSPSRARRWSGAALLALLTLGACRAPTENAPAGTIDLIPLVLLRGSGDTVDLTRTMPAPATSGLLALKQELTPSGAVAIYDTVGRYLTSIGRSGQGPGEFTSVGAVGFGPGDSVVVVDGLLTAHIFSPYPRGRYVRTVRFERPVGATVTEDGFLAGVMATSAGPMPPRLLAWDGTQRAQYGPPRRGENPTHRMGAFAAVDAAFVWSALRGEYTIELLGDDGAVHRQLTRRVDWFPPDTSATAYPWIAPPRPRIHAMVVHDGLLWVLIRRAHRDWETRRRGVAGPTGPARTQEIASIPIEALYEGVIEVLDPWTGRLIASREVGGGVLGFPAPGTLYEVVESESGEISIQVWRVGLRR